MKILLLSDDEQLKQYLEMSGAVIHQTMAPITQDAARGFDWLISYGFRHMVPDDVLELFPSGRSANLHISYLPWNKGSDPNLWSWIEKTPKGVSIHQLTSVLDAGPLYHRRLVAMDIDHDTLATSYAKLKAAMLTLFKDIWPNAVKRGRFIPANQPKEEGSIHSRSDRLRIASKLTNGWDTTVKEICGTN